MKHILLVGLSVGALGVTGCLPDDTRPDPGRVYLTAEPSEETINGFTTDDGWTIRFERVLMALGYVWLVGDGCNAYGNTSYERFFDFTVPGTQKVAEVYGLGQCDLEFLWWTPENDALLGNGVSSHDFRLLEGTEGGKFVTYVQGTAVRGQATKRFELRFERTTYLGDCRKNSKAPPTSSFSIKGGDDLRPNVVIHAENLFRSLEPGATKYEFGLFAEADEDEDGDLSPAEMKKIVYVQESLTIFVVASLQNYLDARRLPLWIELDGALCRGVEPDSGDPLPF